MITARALAEQLGAELAGPEAYWDTSLSTVAPLDKADSDALSFLSSRKYLKTLPRSRAGAVLLHPEHVEQAPRQCALILVSDPYFAYAQVSHCFSRDPAPDSRIHASAIIAEDAVLGEGVSVGANAVIGSGCYVGEGCSIGPGVVLEDRVRLGTGTLIRANVTLCYDTEIGNHCRIQSGTVIGGDGFGYAPHSKGWHRIAQLGRVRIGHRVEIGTNCSIDRGAVEDTVVEDDIIIDNLVQLAHNVVVRRGTALAAQVGVSGSTEIGAGCTVGGQAGFAGHIKIADGSHFTGRAMVTRGTREPGLYSSGWPLQPNREWRRTVARLRRLDSLEQRLKALESGARHASSQDNQEDTE